MLLSFIGGIALLLFGALIIGAVYFGTIVLGLVIVALFKTITGSW